MAELPLKYVIDKYVAGKVRVIWLPGIGSFDRKQITTIMELAQCKCRAYVVGDLNRFAKKTHVPKYDFGNGWCSPNSKQYTLKEFSELRSTRDDPFYNRLRSRKKIQTCLVIRDTKHHVQVIVDGTHRATAVYMNRRKDDRILQVVEISGKLMHMIFPCDLGRLI